MTNKEAITFFEHLIPGNAISEEATRLAIEALKANDVLKEQQPRWISVEEALPKSIINKVLVYLEHEDLVGYIGFGHFERWHGEEIWFDLEHDDSFADRGYRVTHWMELPEKPKT